MFDGLRSLHSCPSISTGKVWRISLHPERSWSLFGTFSWPPQWACSRGALLASLSRSLQFSCSWAWFGWPISSLLYYSPCLFMSLSGPSSFLNLQSECLLRLHITPWYSLCSYCLSYLLNWGIHTPSVCVGNGLLPVYRCGTTPCIVCERRNWSCWIISSGLPRKNIILPVCLYQVWWVSIAFSPVSQRLSLSVRFFSVLSFDTV